MSDNKKVSTRIEYNNNKVFKDLPDILYVPKIGDKETHHIADNEDVALLIAIGEKYQGKNSNFAQMASRMLQIDTVWAK